MFASHPAFAQPFLGTIRGTVVDPQGQVVQGASVLITDEATGVVRTLETDAEGRYEATNVRPGTYRVEVVTQSFKKFERTGVVLRAAGIALVNVNLEVGNLNETVTFAGDALNNITLDIQFLGGRTYGVSYIQDGQASTNAIFGTVGNSAPGLDAVSEISVLSNSYSDVEPLTFAEDRIRIRVWSGGARSQSGDERGFVSSVSRRARPRTSSARRAWARIRRRRCSRPSSRRTTSPTCS